MDGGMRRNGMGMAAAPQRCAYRGGLGGVSEWRVGWRIDSRGGRTPVRPYGWPAATVRAQGGPGHPMVNDTRAGGGRQVDGRGHEWPVDGRGHEWPADGRRRKRRAGHWPFMVTSRAPAIYGREWRGTGPRLRTRTYNSPRNAWSSTAGSSASNSAAVSPWNRLSAPICASRPSRYATIRSCSAKLG